MSDEEKSELEKLEEQVIADKKKPIGILQRPESFWPFDELSWGSHYSCFGISTDKPYSTSITLFGYRRGDYIPHWISPNVIATRVHTNIPCRGSVGLPRDWEHLVVRMRARISLPMSLEVAEYLGACAVLFVRDWKHVSKTTLLDLVHSPQPVGPVHAPRENEGQRRRLQR
ncbi:hypothetical protein LCGC14_1678980 [marine sediment metagenome]|uniref:Uncharacterized protein n=1 Tax=marine sediment metagenome TaxID=412755 RepID=A0A0F9IBL6_9ZZZZ